MKNAGCSNIGHSSRIAGLAVLWIAGGGSALYGGFELAGELPAAFGDPSVIVHRESLEQRSSTEVASTAVVAGRFRVRIEAESGLFKVRVGEAEESFIGTDGSELRVTVTPDNRGLRVDGSSDQALYTAYEELRAASLSRLVYPVRNAIAAARRAADDAEVKRLTEAEIAAYRDHRRELTDFTIEKLGGSAALYAASLRWDGDYRLDELAGVVRRFAARYPDAEIARLMQERIERFRATAIGAEAPPLAGLSPDGATIALQDLRGRYVLVDFWAAWCSPCRIENRSYARLYERHRAGGFEILAVSVDSDARAWKTAMAQDGATWLHISDLSGWKSPLAMRYNVSALPANFLLDREGRIIAKDVRGDELAALLEERLSKSADSTNAVADP